jgi:hypothetical protein
MLLKEPKKLYRVGEKTLVQVWGSHRVKLLNLILQRKKAKSDISIK